MRAFKNYWKRFKCRVKEVYNAIKELQEEFLKYPPRDDFNRGYFAALSKSLVVINEITKKK